MPHYEIEFCDGKKVTKEAPHGDVAKRAAKAERAAQLPPDTPRSAAEVKVTRVTPLD